VSGFSPGRLCSLLALGREGVFWRHDVDFDPRSALRMAEIEADMGISATFYVMPRGPYNPFSLENRRIVRRIVELGHRLGTHVDLALARDETAGEASVFAKVWEDVHLLGRDFPLGLPRRVSFHRPPDDVLWRDFGGFESAYASRWEANYVSDSRGKLGELAETTIEHHVRVGAPLQVNLHPEWWLWP
jgi:hypothetical protein